MMKNKTDMLMRDRAIGTLVGLAVGDALGTTLEFASRDTRPHQSEITGGGPFNLRPGQWTDDTSMALALADSLLSVGEYDPTDLMDRFVSWWKEGAYSSTGTCFDIGVTTSSALDMYIALGRPEIGSHSPDTAGNGSIMRLAPAVLYGFPDVDTAADIAVRQCKTTHGAAECLEACDIMARILVSHIWGRPIEDFRGRYHSSGIKNIASRGWTGKSRDAIKSTGYVVDTLEAALWADARTENFEQALILAVNLAGDADTIGAVTGQICGARYGMAGIPKRWLEKIHDLDVIVDMAERLIDLEPVLYQAPRLGIFDRLVGRR